MKDSKLIKILRTFSAEEIRLFGKFIASPYFNSVKNYSLLFMILMKFHPEFDDDKLNRENIYKKLFRGKPFNKQVMWNLISGFEKLSEEFLEQVALRKNKFERMELLVTEFGNRKLLSNYSRTLNEMEKQLQTNAIEYVYFENKGHLETYKQGYYHLMDKIKPMSDSKLKATEYQILLFLRMTVGGLNDMSVLTKNYNSRFDVNIPLEFAKHTDLKKIVEYAHNKNYEFTFLIEIYYHSLMMLLKPQETEHLDKVRGLYKLNYNRFTLSEKRTIMHWILNYCLLRSESEGIKYERIIFELNEFRLKEGLAFYPEGQIPKANYYQILNTALSVNETKWAENFIKTYTPMLQPEIQEYIGAMAYASLHFQTKQYEKVLENLNNVEFIDIRDKLFARSLMARTYYEMKEFASLLDYIDSTRHFLKNNENLSTFYKEFYGNFFSYLHKLVLIRENNTKENLKSIINKMSIEKTVSHKNWLMEKAKELI